MAIKTTVGQVASDGSAILRRPAGLLVSEPTSRLGIRGKGSNLYVLTEVLGPHDGRDAMADKLVEAARDTYYGWHGSTTAGLQRAILRANDLLLEENRHSVPAERWTAGISVMLLRDDDLFAAQAGPAAAFLVSGGQVTRFPDRPPSLSGAPAQDLGTVSLGAIRDLNVDLFHAQIREGDLAILVRGELGRQLSPSSWTGVLVHSSVHETLGSLVAAAAGNEIAALAVRVGGEPHHPGMIAVGGTQVDAQPEPEASGDALATPSSSETEGHGLLEKLGGVLLAVVAGLGGALLTLLKRMVPGQVSSEPGDAPGADTVVAQAQSAGQPKGPAPDPARGALVQKLLTAVAIAIPLIVIAAVLYLVVQRDQAQKAEIDALWTSASQSWQMAEGADATSARSHLGKAEQTLGQLLLRRPDNAEAAELRGRVQARLDEINQVRRITWVAGLKSYPAGADLTRVVVQGVNVFVLDKNSGRVYHHQLDESLQALEPATADNVLVARGDQVGDVLVGDLVDMVWMPAGGGRQKAGLVILESGGSALGYDPTTDELTPLKVAASDTWQFPKVVGSYFGRFYVLDTTESRILRYQPTAQGYSSAPDDWLQEEADLTGVIDMAIGDSIYLLYSDGELLKYSAGEADTFEISDWDAPTDSPGALFARPPDKAKSVYVADRGNNRIVQSGKDGRFERQFRIGDSLESEFGEALRGVSSLFVDEIGGRAYLLSDRMLYVIVLPD
ncbi:hypothetical protein ACFLWA_09935 [Chloroflexota bacterium]